MTRTWTEEQEGWLADRYGSATAAELAAEFSARFGCELGASALSTKASKMGLRRRPADVPRRAVRRVRWACEPEMSAWMEGHDRGQPVAALSREFASRFGFPLSASQVSAWRSSRGRQSRRSHGGGRAARPVGSERDTRKGYVLVKVSEHPRVPQSRDNWRMKHVVAWEREHGPLPDGMVVVFADRDHTNYDPANLVAVPKRLIARLNAAESPGWWDAESLSAAVAWCELQSAVVGAEARLPRTCGVCGRRFVPAGGAREAVARNAGTCPECLAAGHRSRGERTVKAVVACAVCGRSFGATQRNQRRCPDCIAAAPFMSASKQAAARRAGGGSR